MSAYLSGWALWSKQWGLKGPGYARLLSPADWAAMDFVMSYGGGYMREAGIMGIEWRRYTAGVPEWARSMLSQRVSMILHTADAIHEADREK